MRPRTTGNTSGKVGLRRRAFRGGGFTMLESVVAVIIMVLLLSLVLVNGMVMIRRARLDEDVARFARTLRLTAHEAITRGQELIVHIDVTDGFYTVYETDEKKSLADRKPLVSRNSLDRYYIEKIEFEHNPPQFSGELILRATPEGWKQSVVFSFKEGVYGAPQREHFMRCDRLTPRVVSSKEPLELQGSRIRVSMVSPL